MVDKNNSEVPKSQPPADNESKSPTSDVGYGRPPHHSQFKKGQSGNPKGRPKGSKNLSTYIEQELKQKITVTENGVRKCIPKKQAIAKQFVNKAASGDLKTVPLLLNEERNATQQTGAAPADTPMTDEDERVIESLVRRIRDSEPLRSEHPTPTETPPGTATPETNADHGGDDDGDPGVDP